MKRSEFLKAIKSQTRLRKSASEGSKFLGPLIQLPGTWESKGLGWNIIALPFASAQFKYRVLMNQYDETLKFKTIAERVPNRGVPSKEFPPERLLPKHEKSDQFLTTIDYEQAVTQIAAADSPATHLAGGKDLDIHHEPGLFLNMHNKKTNNIDIARLATVPHGDSVLALGKSDTINGAPKIPKASAMPLFTTTDINNPYLSPYKTFVDAPFKGTVKAPGFPGFSPIDANVLLRLANASVKIKKTTVLPFDTTLETGGIVNIPFIVKQANAVEMQSTFWIQELDQVDEDGSPVLRLQYTQTVMLDFFKSRSKKGKLIRWPHISINTLTKLSKSEEARREKERCEKILA